MGDGITTLNIIIKTEKMVPVYEEKMRLNFTWEEIILDWAKMKKERKR